MFHPRYTYKGNNNPNTLSGVFPTWSDPLLPYFSSKLRSAHLSYNQFSGPFPPIALRSMTGIKYIAGATNKFDSVDFSRNGGTMWPKEGALACDLSDNDLTVVDNENKNYFSDHIIKGSPGNRFFGYLKMRNMGFTGEISDYICDDLVSWNYTAFGENKDTGTIDFLDLTGNNFDCYARCLTSAETNPRALEHPFYFRSNTDNVCVITPTVDPTPTPTSMPTPGVPTAAPTGNSQNAATYDILLAMYSSFQGVENQRFDNWDFTKDGNEYASNPCTDQWWGLICNEYGDISEITMSNSELTGTIPPELGNLQSLSKLDFANNNLDGELPISIFSLSRLWSLNVSANMLNGNIGSSLGLSRTVYSMDLSSNRFTGPVDYLAGAMALETLNLANNQFTGKTEAFNSIYRLTNLDISGNMFSGPFFGMQYGSEGLQ